MASGIRRSQRRSKQPICLKNEMTDKTLKKGSEGDPVLLDDDEDDKNTREMIGGSGISEPRDDSLHAQEYDETHEDYPDKQTSGEKTRKKRGKKYEYMGLGPLKEAYKKLREEFEDHSMKSKQVKQDLEHKNRELNTHNKNATRSLKEEEAERRNWEQQYKQAQQQIANLRNSLDEQARQHNRAIRQHEKAEKALQAKIDNDQYQCLPDDIVQEKLKLTKAQCSEWVKEWQNMNHMPNFDTVWKDIDSVCINPAVEGLGMSLKEHLQKKGPAGSRLVCMTLLMRSLLYTYFLSPFGLFKKDGCDVTVANALVMTQDLLAVGDEQKAIAWRAETVRCLKQTLQAAKQIPHNDEQRIKLEKISLYEARRFVTNLYHNGLLKAITDLELNKAIEELARIYIDVALLSLDLWSRKMTTEIVDMKELCKKPFSVKSDEYAAHPSVGLDDDDESFDGRPIQMVIIPAIRAAGLRQDDGRREELIWCQGQVVMFPDLQKNDKYVSKYFEVQKLHHRLRSAAQAASKQEKEPNPKRQKTRDTSTPPQIFHGAEFAHATHGSKQSRQAMLPDICEAVGNRDCPPTRPQETCAMGKSSLQEYLDSINVSGKMYDGSIHRSSESVAKSTSKNKQTD